MSQHTPAAGPNLLRLADALTADGWSVRFVPGTDTADRRWPLEAVKGTGRVEVPRGNGGRYAPSVQRLRPDGTTEWGALMTPDTPLPVLLATATAAAGG